MRRRAAPSAATASRLGKEFAVRQASTCMRQRHLPEQRRLPIVAAQLYMPVPWSELLRSTLRDQSHGDSSQAGSIAIVRVRRHLGAGLHDDIHRGDGRVEAWLRYRSRASAGSKSETPKASEKYERPNPKYNLRFIHVNPPSS